MELRHIQVAALLLIIALTAVLGMKFAEMKTQKYPFEKFRQINITNAPAPVEWECN